MTTVSSFSSLSPPLPCRPITQKKGSPIPTSTAAVLPIQTRWVWKAAAAKTIIQPGIPKCFNQPFNNVLARVFSLFWLDGWGQLGWTVQLQKSPLRRSMDCFLLFYTKHIPHKLPMVSSLQLVLVWCGGVNHCSPFFMPSLYLDYTSTLFALWLRFLPLEVECISSLN